MSKGNTGRFFALKIALILLLCARNLYAAGKQPPKPTIDDCLACHSDATLSHEVNGKNASLYVNPKAFKDSIHGGMFTCVDCHTDVTSAVHETTPKKITCAQCHADQQTAYDRSFHAKAVQGGNTRAATCVDCHGSPHELLPASDPKSRVHHNNIPATCGSCHGRTLVMLDGGQGAQMVASYGLSVHGHAVATGSEKAAVCTDCHGTHEILDAKDSKSPIFKFNVPTTCGQCHEAISKEFKASIHGQAIAQGNWQAPVCTDCHGIHSIKSHTDPNSPVNAQNLAQATCARCHEGMRLSQEFGVQGRRETTYLASYHGLASKMGSQVVANCASCHGSHSILPSSDPRSSINAANLAHTCGQCHPGVNAEFAAAKVHVDAPLSADMGSKLVRWIRKFYLSMIFVVIGGMLLHNFILWRWKVLDRRKLEHNFVTRMASRFRWQHATLLLSFIILVLTGFALKFPDSWFASMMSMGEHFRRMLHRAAAVVLIAVSIYHLFDIAFSRPGRKLVRDLFPTLEDARGAWQNIAFHLGLLPAKPEFRRFNYAEKAEYWALVWGMFVMAGTGLMLWAKVSVGNHLPRWWLDVATAIHFYEAVLATLAIVVWHFYQVFFDPDVYPMNWAWWDGKMPLHHYQEEHALDSATLLEAASAAKTPEAEAAAAHEEKTSGKNAAEGDQEIAEVKHE
ncbi:MAG TPA: cytochrome b/b6 domain-containing protein [Candidatus Sulfotelmatobacter sp.]|nr:cytochrome b/b6 domain-containing protein [Candidatus Sulfotelmatobacter sp.]